jgi:hypothetical protein
MSENFEKCLCWSGAFLFFGLGWFLTGKQEMYMTGFCCYVAAASFMLAFLNSNFGNKK